MNLLTKFQNKYFSSKAFFGLDLCLSVGASVIVLLVLSFFVSSSYYSGNFAWWWIGGSVAASIITMFVFKEYKLVVRYLVLGFVGSHVDGRSLQSLQKQLERY